MVKKIYYLEWKPTTKLKKNSEGVYQINGTNSLPNEPGIYIFGKQRGTRFEALYVGRSNKVKNRIENNHLRGTKIPSHLNKFKNSQKIIHVGLIKCNESTSKQTQNYLKFLETKLIRHFLENGHSLVNRMGTAIIPPYQIKSRGEKSMPLPKVLLFD